MCVWEKRLTKCLNYKEEQSYIINCILIIFILFVSIPQGIDSREKGFLYAFYTKTG